jgi:hypothetical protein
MPSSLDLDQYYKTCPRKNMEFKEGHRIGVSPACGDVWAVRESLYQSVRALAGVFLGRIPFLDGLIAETRNEHNLAQMLAALTT